jgi:hypothetical protein
MTNSGQTAHSSGGRAPTKHPRAQHERSSRPQPAAQPSRQTRAHSAIFEPVTNRLRHQYRLSRPFRGHLLTNGHFRHILCRERSTIVAATEADDRDATNALNFDIPAGNA